ncbi:GNAT family N-acetyltransferase [Paenibacillus mucilaginosus]|uniref:N-acetyltransferase domain-containing protein n=1 Tax=Paenibacillus mucilaginosus K02 TaxID=997761 RepID=I0BJC7_9BACL|nr:GNAT family N-acetyltransferase [Paenibacillus mucilaginosus]AFH62474.1 hypothetical protein B2K_17400 [Paenibacillus mucilaginosus K02]MCG7214386.1 GNAT family N-acetyltransferase [Paenibacillus mucilaginosus]WDM30672.1 GNAT family N-acetyltransferase [Paenibacillus mucilaginosus]
MNPLRVTQPEELETAFTIRTKVFVEEQGVALEDEFDEWDTLNGPCEHIVACFDGQPAGTGRVRLLHGFAKLERICILKPYRKHGIGKIIIRTLEGIAEEKGAQLVQLHGQTQAQGFYEKLGYRVSSEEFMEDGIPHILMRKELSKAEQ